MAALLSVLSMMFTLLSPLPRIIAQNASRPWAGGWGGKRLGGRLEKVGGLTGAPLARVGAALHDAAFHDIAAAFYDLDCRVQYLFALAGLGLIPDPPDGVRIGRVPRQQGGRIGPHRGSERLDGILGVAAQAALHQRYQ